MADIPTTKKDHGAGGRGGNLQNTSIFTWFCLYGITFGQIGRIGRIRQIGLIRPLIHQPHQPPHHPKNSTTLSAVAERVVLKITPGDVLSSRRLAPQVLSALEGVPVVFGMGTGVSPPP